MIFFDHYMELEQYYDAYIEWSTRIVLFEGSTYYGEFGEVLTVRKIDVSLGDYVFWSYDSPWRVVFKDVIKGNIEIDTTEIIEMGVLDEPN